MKNCFPHPISVSDIITMETYRNMSNQEIYSILTDPTAWDWDEKSDSSYRFLCSQGWVFKTRTRHRNTDISVVMSRLTQSLYLTKLLKIWHPAKTWFILSADGYYWIANMTPKMTTLEEIPVQERKKKWGRKERSLKKKTLRYYRLYLDSNSRNFGFCKDGKLLYYLDDEVYFSGTHMERLLGKERKTIVLS
jgi:hypothetical protein